MSSAPASPAPKKAYTYVSPTYSWLFVNYLKPLYNWIGPRLFPDFVHANVVTLLGGFSALLSFVLVWLFSDCLTNYAAVPSWVFVLSGLLFWFYMICDNCDGIQARRLGISSPVGELLDHGVDSLVICTASRVFAFVMLGRTPEEKLWWSSFAGAVLMSVFYASHVISVCTGVLIMGFKFFSVDELFILHGLVLVVAGLVGNPLENIRVPIPSVLREASPLWGIPLKESEPAAEVICVLVTLTLGTALLSQVILLAWKYECRKSRGFAGKLAFLWVFGRCILVVTATLSATPFNGLWMCTWAPIFSLLCLSLVLRHMKERTIRWLVPTLLVIATRFVPALLFDFSASFLDSSSLLGAIQQYANNLNRHPITNQPSQGWEGLIALDSALLALSLFFITVSSMLERMQREYQIASLFFVGPNLKPAAVPNANPAVASAPKRDATTESDTDEEEDEAKSQQPTHRSRSQVSSRSSSNLSTASTATEALDLEEEDEKPSAAQSETANGRHRRRSARKS